MRKFYDFLHFLVIQIDSKFMLLTIKIANFSLVFHPLKLQHKNSLNYETAVA